MQNILSPMTEFERSMGGFYSVSWGDGQIWVEFFAPAWPLDNLTTNGLNGARSLMLHRQDRTIVPEYIITYESIREKSGRRV